MTGFTRARGRTVKVTRTKQVVGDVVAQLQGDVDWYRRPREQIHEAIFGRIRQIKNNQIARRFELFTYQQRYSAKYGPAISGTLFSPTARSASVAAIQLNVIKSVIDTAQARIAKGKVRPFALPRKGDYRLKRKARWLTKFLDGAFRLSGAYEAAEEVFRDACIFGTSQCVIDPLALRDGILRTELVKVDELHIDMVDGMKDRPSEWHWLKAVPRTELIARFPDFEAQINEARMSWRGDMSYMGKADQVEVAFSWRARSTPTTYDGRFVISIPTVALLDEPWEGSPDKPPILRFHWSPPTYGCFGDGIAKSLAGCQQAILDIARGIVKSIRNFAAPRVWVNKLAGVNSKTISNEMSVNEYAGERPVFDTPQAASADVYQFLQWLIDWCYKQEGLSQLSAQSEKPAGLNAAVAMRTYHDIETQRFSIVGQRWERFYLQLARMHVEAAEKIYGAKGKLSVMVPGRGFVEKVDWADISLDRDAYDLAVWPTNILPETPEGKLQMVQELVSSGFMPLEVAAGQLDLPILHDWVAEMTAARDNIERMLDSIVDDGKFVPPDDATNFELGKRMVLAQLNEAPANDVEPAKIELLQRWLDEVTAREANANAQAMQRQQQMANLAGPQGGPVVGRAPAPGPAPLAPATGAPVKAAA